MNGKHYSEESLSALIDAAHQYIDDPGVRERIIGKCYQELGLIVAGAPVYQRANITLTNQEAAAMREAVQLWRREKEQSRNKSG